MFVASLSRPVEVYDASAVVQTAERNGGFRENESDFEEKVTDLNPESLARLNTHICRVIDNFSKMHVWVK